MSDGLCEVSRDFRQSSDEEVPEGVPLQLSLGEAVLEEAPEEFGGGGTGADA